MKQFILLNAIMIVASFSASGQSQSHERSLFVTSRDSIQIAYETHGKGKVALVFVHGWACDRSYWKNQLEQFSAQYKVVAIDLAGHGESGLGRKEWTIAAFGGDVVSVVEKMGLQHMILVGHSMGGDVIMEAAKRLPGSVIGLVMVDTYKKLGTGRTPEQVHDFIQWLSSNFVDSTRALVRSMFVPQSDKVLVEQVANNMSSRPPAVALPALESAFNYSREITHSLEELKLPVITINSGNSPTDTASMKRYGVEVVVMPGVGHFMMLEDPNRFNHLLANAIDTLIKRQH